MSQDLYTKLQNPSLTQTINEVFGNDLGKKKQLNVIIFGYFGVFNIGDDAILQAEINELKKLRLDLRIITPSQNPEFIRKEYKIDSIASNNIFQLLQTIHRCDLIVFGGGGLICKIKDNSSLKKVLIDNLFTIYKAFFYFILPKLLRKKIIVFGIGFYPNISKFQKYIYLNIMKLANYISVRDKISFDFLSENTNLKVSYQKDVAFLLNNSDIEKNIISKLNNLIEIKNKINVGISLLTTNFKKKDDLITDQIARLITEYSEDCNFYFFPFYTEPSTTNDKTMEKILLEKARFNRSFKQIPYSVGPNGFQYLFSRLNYSVSMRFHAQVFSYKSNIPFLGISYDKKCKSFLDQISAKYIEVDSIDQSNLYLKARRDLLTLIKKQARKNAKK